jgi:hypothetical protein
VWLQENRRRDDGQQQHLSRADHAKHLAFSVSLKRNRETYPYLTDKELGFSD